MISSYTTHQPSPVNLQCLLGTETTIATETAKQISDTELRHARLGHPGVKLYNTMARLLGYNTIKQPNTTFCPTCCLSKAVTRKGVPSLKTYTHPLELIQVDICGGFRYDSYNNKKYFLTIRTPQQDTIVYASWRRKARLLIN